MWVYSRRRSCPAAALGCSCTAPAPGGCSASPSLSSRNADGGLRAETVCLHTVNTHKIVCSLALCMLNVCSCMHVSSNYMYLCLKCVRVPLSAVCVCGPAPGPTGSSVCLHPAGADSPENLVCPAEPPPFSPETPNYC